MRGDFHSHHLQLSVVASHIKTAPAQLQSQLAIEARSPVSLPYIPPILFPVSPPYLPYLSPLLAIEALSAPRPNLGPYPGRLRLPQPLAPKPQSPNPKAPAPSPE